MTESERLARYILERVPARRAAALADALAFVALALGGGAIPLAINAMCGG